MNPQEEDYLNQQLHRLSFFDPNRGHYVYHDGSRAHPEYHAHHERYFNDPTRSQQYSGQFVDYTTNFHGQMTPANFRSSPWLDPYHTNNIGTVAQDSLFGSNLEPSGSGLASDSHGLHASTGPMQNVYHAHVPENHRPVPLDSKEVKLFSSFKQRKDPVKFFTEGKVFLTLWTEPACSDSSTATTGVSVGQYGERAFSKTRRFVVVRTGDLRCTVTPISTYRGRGVAAPGKRKADHAIVYSGKNAPTWTEAEAPEEGEQGLFLTAIRIDPDDPAEKLDPMSRLNLREISTIDHRVKVRGFGRVNPKSMTALRAQLTAVWASTWRDNPSLETEATDSETSLTRRHTISGRCEEEEHAWTKAKRILKEQGMSDEQIRTAVRYSADHPAVGLDNVSPLVKDKAKHTILPDECGFDRPFTFP